MHHNLGKRKLNKIFWSLFKEMCFAVMFEHLISALVLGVSRVAAEVSIAGVYLSVY